MVESQNFRHFARSNVYFRFHPWRNVNQWPLQSHVLSWRKSLPSSQHIDEAVVAVGSAKTISRKWEKPISIHIVPTFHVVVVLLLQSRQ